MTCDFNKWLIYDETSPTCLRWKINTFKGQYYKTPATVAGDVAGNIKKDGTISTVMIQGVAYYCNRVVFLLHNKEIPDGHVVDHEDGDRSNNRISNLRPVTQLINCRNQKLRKTNESGYTGVCYHVNSVGNKYWRAQWMSLNGKVKSAYFNIEKLGNDEAFRLACEHRDNMIEELNAQGAGYSARHGTRRDEDDL